MNILLTGGNGFIAMEIFNSLKDEFTFIKKSRNEMNLLDIDAIDRVFSENHIDIVIHTAIVGGRRTQKEDFDVVYYNLLSYENLMNICKKYNTVKLFVNIGTCASFSRQRNIENEKEENLETYIPKDYYGFSKFLIEKDMLYRKLPFKCINLRVFNIFCENELDDRFIKGSILKALRNDDIHIFNDIYFDFFSSFDFIKIIRKVITNYDSFIYTDYNITYTEKYKLSSIGNYIIKKLNSSSKLIIDDESTSNISGNNERLDSLNIELAGLFISIDKMISKITCQ
jgi:nucleoside-diphosphate-sugar epimerase